MLKISYLIVSFTLFLIGSVSFSQQNLVVPDQSPAATVSQVIGLTQIEVTYHRPQVNGRKIWGALVPYEQVWRAGANENTTISFSTDVIVGNEKIPAGKYGLHMLPSEKEWTVIFSKDNEAWGSFFYKPENDAARVIVKPAVNSFEEWLSYSFNDITPNSTTLYLKWEKLIIPIRIEIDLQKTVVENMEKQLTGLPGFFWQGWNQLAAYALRDNYDLQKALEAVNKSIAINKNVNNLMVKSVVLEGLEQKDEAERLRNEALSMKGVDENQMNQFGYQLLGFGRIDEAIQVFQKNTENYPNSWNVWDSLAEGYLNKGDKVKAEKYYKKALDMAPENQKDRIKGILKNIK